PSFRRTETEGLVHLNHLQQPGRRSFDLAANRSRLIGIGPEISSGQARANPRLIAPNRHLLPPIMASVRLFAKFCAFVKDSATCR
ncbi:hypothetical protein, partial [Mesorhizobium sp.]|uniref:hypothetical protein n=1 Tax=Mesorhizobium sp. TaxID=1871066 RepID=UPI0025BC0DC1